MFSKLLAWCAHDVDHWQKEVGYVALIKPKHSITLKTILYVTDYSTNSVAALKYAYNMSIHMGTRLVVAHVFDYPTVLGTEGLDEPFPHLEENAHKMHRSKLEAFCEEHLGRGYEKPNVQ